MMRHFLLTLALWIAGTTLFAQTDRARLEINPLTEDFYIYTTYNTYEGNYIPAHGMYVLTDAGVVLFDTPWDSTQFQPLLDSIQRKHGQRVQMCIATHWHDDRTAGLAYYQSLGIRTYTTGMTDQLSAANGNKRAEFLMTQDTSFQVGQHSFEIYYPGEGHTADNIIAWFEQEKVLYGGCLIKGAKARNLGYLGDANVQEYENTLRKVQIKCPDPHHIVVSHHDWTNTNSLKHSIRLAKRLKRQNAKSAR